MKVPVALFLLLPIEGVSQNSTLCYFSCSYDINGPPQVIAIFGRELLVCVDGDSMCYFLLFSWLLWLGLILMLGFTFGLRVR
jgi:hypothetical protein